MVFVTPAKENDDMRHFLIFLPLQSGHTHLHERVLTTAQAFFATVAQADRRDLGLFQRSARPKKPTELLPLVVLSSPAEPTVERDVARARALEGVLRSTLGAAGVNPVDVRVFVDVPSEEEVTA
jgi:hypothetical protein